MKAALAPLALLLLCAAPTRAQVGPPDRLSLTWENDLVAGTDRHYTNGMVLELAGRLDPLLLPAWLAADEAEWGLTVGQQMYTPERLSEVNVISDDRPYGGFCGAGAFVRRRLSTLGWEDRIQLTLGVIGPSSGAHRAQELAHTMLSSEPPRGWHNQMRDELGVALSYQGSLRLARVDVGGLGCDLRPRMGATLGNVATFVSLGLGVRIGLNLPERLGPEPAAPALRVYLLAGADVRLVGHDVFLDGSLFRDGGHRIEKERMVTDLRLGFVVAIYDRVTLSYVHTVRSREFVGQRRGNQYGSLTLSISW